MKDMKKTEETGTLGKAEESGAFGKPEKLKNVQNLEETKVREKGKNPGEISINTPHDKG